MQAPSPISDLQSLAELLSGSRLDGACGWKPLDLGEIVARGNEHNGQHASLASGRSK